MATLRHLLETQAFIRVPLKTLLTGHYLFHAEVNGIKADFILDTGASTSCIGLAYGAHFAFNQEESLIKAAGAGAINMETMLARKNLFTIGKAFRKKMDFVLFDLSHVNEALNQVSEGPVHGIVGADFLKAHRAVIDYGRNCFYIK